MACLVDSTVVQKLKAMPDPAVSGTWPDARLKILAESGVFRWALPEEFGGIRASGWELLDGYMTLSRACLTTAFILTQRDAAIHRICRSENTQLQQQVLPDHSAGRAMATVGISHLSTSRQHWSRPSVMATRTSSGFEVTGEAPWVTGARYCDLLVTGATLEDGKQILVAIPPARERVTVREPLQLLALTASATGTVTFDGVQVSPHELVAGPADNVMKAGTSQGTGSLTTVAVTLGAALNTIDCLTIETQTRPQLNFAVGQFRQESDRLQADLQQAAFSTEAEISSLAGPLRYRANSLAARSAMAFMSVSKGAGFVAGHDAERSIREAMFFQVWSCPAAVTENALLELATAPRVP